MSIPEILLTQVAISLLVVTVYHLWVSRKRRPATAPSVVAPLLATPRAAVAHVVKLEPAAPAAAASIATAPKAAPVVEPVGPETIAIIAAAIAVVLGRSHRVVSVQPAAAQTPAVNVWALEGRVEQFMSHKIR